MSINTRKLIKMARKWQMTAALRRKRVSFPHHHHHHNAITDRGHFVVYTADDQNKRYSFPIAYLNSYIFRELFRMAEEEFGLPSDGPITVPCDAVFMDYLLSLMQRNATKDIEKALLFAAACRCSSSSSSSSYNYNVIHHRETNFQHHLPVVM